MAGLKADAATRIDSASGLIQGLPRWTATTTCSRAVWTVTALLEEKATPRKRSTVHFLYWFFEWRMTPTIYLSLSLYHLDNFFNITQCNGRNLDCWSKNSPLSYDIAARIERTSWFIKLRIIPFKRRIFLSFFFDEFRYKKLTTILKFFILKLRKENSVYHGMVNPRGGGGNKNTEG